MNLLHEGTISKKEFTKVIKPDVMLLKKDYPQHEKFSNAKFWGLATVNGKIIDHGFKMKWHNIGNGKVQLRLCVTILKNKAFLCHSYVKRDEKIDKKEMSRFKIKIQKIIENKHEVRAII